MKGLIGTACALPAALAFAMALTQSDSAPAQAAVASQPAAPAQAQAMEVPGKPDVSRISGGHYAADPQHTLVEWRVDHMGLSPYYGLFGQVTGTLDINPARPEQARLAVDIPIRSLSVASEELKQHLFKAPEKAGAAPDFFGPQPGSARFVSTMVKVSGEDMAELTGNLTLNGETRPVTLDVKFYGAGKSPPQMGGGENIGFEATGTIKRSEFGLGFGVPMVSDAVELHIAAAFMKEPAKAE
jgi:Uncharacterized conserved protein